MSRTEQTDSKYVWTELPFWWDDRSA